MKAFLILEDSLHCRNERLRITSIPTSPASPKKLVEQGEAIQTVSMWSLECIGTSTSHNLTFPETLHISITTLIKHQLTSLVSVPSFISDNRSFSECILDLIPPLHLAQTKCVGNHLYNTLDQVFSLTLHHHSDSVFVTRKNNNQSSWHITSPSEKLIFKAQASIEEDDNESSSIQPLDGEEKEAISFLVE